LGSSDLNTYRIEVARSDVVDATGSVRSGRGIEVDTDRSVRAVVGTTYIVFYGLVAKDGASTAELLSVADGAARRGWPRRRVDDGVCDAGGELAAL